MKARFTTLCGCEQVLELKHQRSSLPRVYTLLCHIKAVDTFRHYGTDVRQNMRTREFQLIGVDALGTAQYLEIER